MNNVRFYYYIFIIVFIHLPLRSTPRTLSILYVVETFPVLSETFILYQITNLLDAGHNVRIYAQKKGKKLIHKEFYDYNLQDRIIYDHSSKNEKSLFFGQHSFDIVICHFGTRGYLGEKVRAQYDIQAPLITVFHGYDMSRTLRRNRHFYDKLFVSLDLALPVSEYWKKKLTSLGYDQEKIYVHHMGVDCQNYAYKDRTYDNGQPICFLSISRFVTKKGLKYAVQAFARVLKKYPNIEYILIGDGPCKASIEALAKSLNITQNIHFLGNKTQEELHELASKGHIFLAPSITSRNGNEEGIPVSIMEAMARGLPVISTYHSGIPELVQDKITGFLVPEKDVNALSEKMEYLIEHPELWRVMGKAGRARIEEEFNLEKQNAQLINFFEYALITKNKT
ncbi:MAG: glycosyltransferase [Candidatus Babeliales bacterium]